MTSPPDATFQLSQKAFIRRGDAVLILNDPACGLDFPGGRVQAGEGDLAAALRREVVEETGMEIEVGAPFVTWIDHLHRAFVQSGQPVVVVGYRCVWRAGELRLSDEHDGGRWLPIMAVDEVDDGSAYFAALRTYTAA